MGEPRTITLREYETLELQPADLSDADAELIHRLYSKKIEVVWPSIVTGHRWRLRSLGWVGSVTLRSGLRLHLEPKVPIVGIFRMLEYAYRLQSFQVLKGVTWSEQLEEVYQRLAVLLARLVLQRCRRGLYRAYVADEQRLPYVRGTVDVARSLRTPWETSLHCAYHEHTADVEENQLLAWTLHVIIRQGVCAGPRREQVMAAWRALRGTVELRAFNPDACLGRLYHRLNSDYHPMHALCRFFLMQTGPHHAHGERESIPFLVDMAALYEAYVAEYLQGCIGPDVRLTPQHHVAIDPTGGLDIHIDLVLTDAATGAALAVLDTKYKRADRPAAADLQQVVAYAVAKNCTRAVLIYPVTPKMPFTGRYGAGDVEVITTTVSPDGEVGDALRVLLGGSVF